MIFCNLKKFYKLKFQVFVFLICTFQVMTNCYPNVRLKDLLSVKGVRTNPIWGYGLVVGLNGTGDGGGEITIESLKRMLKNVGLNPKKELSAKNSAAVIVSAKLPPFSRVGQKIDITVSSIGDASSLAGGTLLLTPLKGGDSKVYALGQGQVSIGGLTQGQEIATTGRVVNGAVIEREVKLEFDKKNSLRLTLHSEDFSTAFRVTKQINSELGGLYAKAKDSRTIDVKIPTFYQRKVVELMALLENFSVEVDQKAKIVVNERTGTIVTGGEIYLNEVVLAHKDLTIAVGGGGEEDGAAKKENYFYHTKERAKLKDFVSALNDLGVTPEDMIPIFQALKKNGSIVGEIEFI